MDRASYAEEAVRLVNADLIDAEALRVHLSDRPERAAAVGDRDLVTLRGLQRRLREVFGLAGGGRHREAVDALNALLARSPMTPQAAAHEGGGWHVHVAARGRGPGDDLAAEALFGLLGVVVERGPQRLGTCAAPDCRGVLLDTSPGGTKRYCSPRCASRSNVAAFRARASAPTGRNAP